MLIHSSSLTCCGFEGSIRSSQVGHLKGLKNKEGKVKTHSTTLVTPPHDQLDLQGGYGTDIL